ncbi:MAG: penicillin-binding protein 1C [Paracoccaceae bacterium]
MTGARWIAALAVALGVAAGARDGFDQWVARTELPPLAVETGAEVLARDGTLLRAYTVADGRWRLAVTPDAVDPAFQALLIAYEDQRFYSHAGVDPLALLRAAGQALMTGHIVSGGSTLTMQVARLLEDSGTGRFSGKLRQMRLALALERHLDKQEIIGLYLHLAPYGGNIEGIRAASLTYFGKEPRRLTPAEAALLVALPQAPEARRPDRHPAAAASARARVLARLETLGALAPDRAAAALREPVPGARRPFPALAPHLTDRLTRARPDRGRFTLTIDASLQSRLEALAAAAMAGRGERLQVAILVADHRSGAVLASVGSSAYRADRRQGFVDMTRALRSPGSTLKPLVYALAFDEGLGHPETLIDDRPVRFGTYAPQNFDKRFRGTLRMREALQLSLNIPVVLLTEALGPARLMAALERAGARPVLPTGQPGLAVALGGVGITLEDLVATYAALAHGGRAVALRYEEAAPGEGRRVVSSAAAWQVADILSGVAPPAGAPANRLAYKTGTSYGHRDAWALGFDGAHVIGVWMGRADGTPVPGAFGGELAAPILFQAFQRLKPVLEPLPPAPPETLLVANPQLPPPLRRFRGRDAAFAADPLAPTIAFPPDGAEVALDGAALMARVDRGAPPFTWLANGRPVLVASRDRQVLLDLTGPGFVTLSVIDAAGQSARSAITLSP